MFERAIQVAKLIAVLGTSSSIAYYVLCIWSAKRFLQSKARAPQAAPVSAPISILKPLKGTDPEMYESFRSHCLQDYADYELVFGVSDPSDPAIASVQRLSREFPQRSIQLVFCPKVLGP